MRPLNLLFISGSVGLGHVTRDLAIANELRARWPTMRLLWLAAEPALQVLREAGEELAPECARYGGETAFAEAIAGKFSLPLTNPVALLRRPIRLSRGIAELWRNQRANLSLFRQITRREHFDLIIGDETYDLMLALARRPALKPASLALIGDFVGLDAVSANPLEWLFVQSLSRLSVGFVKRFPRFCDRILLIGEREDVADKPLAFLLPNRRTWAATTATFVGYVLPLRVADYADQAAVRRRLGFGSEPLIVCAIGGTQIGKALLELCGRAYPILRQHLPGLRMIAVAGPRLSPDALSLPEGVERRGYVHHLFELLAASDLSIVQGGGTTTLELTALRRPFIYFPLEGHFEQRVHVARRIAAHGAGVRMEFHDTSPARLAEAVLANIGAAPHYPPIRSNGAERAADALERMCSRSAAR